MKKILVMFASIAMILSMTGCNRQIVDTTFSYNRAIIHLPDGTIIDGKVQSWKDYEDGDQIQVKIDGVTYLVDCMNIVLISE